MYQNVTYWYVYAQPRDYTVSPNLHIGDISHLACSCLGTVGLCSEYVCMVKLYIIDDNIECSSPYYKKSVFENHCSRVFWLDKFRAVSKLIETSVSCCPLNGPKVSYRI